MDELSALLEEDPQVPESASAEDKKVLEPLMKTYDELNEQGLKMSDNNPDPILEFVDNLVADVDNGIKAKGEQPGSDVITYTDLYAFLASNTGEKKLDLKGYNGEALKHLPLREYIYYSPEMSDIEVAAFNFYWGELMAYTYSADEEGNPSDRFYTDPVLIEGKYQVVDSNTVIINKTQFTEAYS
ncbi:hypothetical protein GCM10007359_17010 [Rothia aerolata]|uniref:Uncharacterized protein n=2 Tax=Rothia aerolata TaxID=1812262 RepID=A0A917IVP6_9MICC|nr:hypothetical protein GCM10007359_17010 [Rothia aerolata]